MVSLTDVKNSLNDVRDLLIDGVASDIARPTDLTVVV